VIEPPPEFWFVSWNRAEQCLQRGVLTHNVESTISIHLKHNQCDSSETTPLSKSNMCKKKKKNKKKKKKTKKKTLKCAPPQSKCCTKKDLVSRFLSVPDAVLALSQPASNLQDLIRA